jgi:hypothetical protein
MARTRMYEDTQYDEVEVDVVFGQSRRLTPFEKKCADGHAVYLRLLEAGEVDHRTAPSSMVKVRDKSRGPMVMGMKTVAPNPRFHEALAEYHKKGGSMYTYCKTNFTRWGYRSCLSMYSVFKITRHGSTAAVARKPQSMKRS